LCGVWQGKIYRVSGAAHFPEKIRAPRDPPRTRARIQEDAAWSTHSVNGRPEIDAASMPGWPPRGPVPQSGNGAQGGLVRVAVLTISLSLRPSRQRDPRWQRARIGWSGGPARGLDRDCGDQRRFTRSGGSRPRAMTAGLDQAVPQPGATGSAVSDADRTRRHRGSSPLRHPRGQRVAEVVGARSVDMQAAAAQASSRSRASPQPAAGGDSRQDRASIQVQVRHTKTPW